MAQESGAKGHEQRPYLSRTDLLIASGTWPHVSSSKEAANVICHEIVDHLAQSGRFNITYACINCRAIDIPEAAKPELAALQAAGVRFLDPIIVDPRPVGATSLLSRAGCLLRGRPDRLLSGTDRTAQLISALDGRVPDLVLTIWSEIAGNLVSTLPVSHRVAYAVNPDHKVLDARLELEERLGIMTVAARLRNRARREATRLAHLQVMRRFDLMWNVAANDAAQYRAEGINAQYLQNMWPTDAHLNWESLRDEGEQMTPLKIVGNVGNLGATGNSFGLLTLATEIVPELKRRLGEGAFEVHLFGGGNPHPAVGRYLQDSHIKVRGFVEDLEKEILSAPIFLVANNSHRFKVGHTRFLHAWSLGAAVVGFSDSAQAMPEIVHGYNCLLGHSAAEVAAHVASLATAQEQRRTLGRNGAATLAHSFAPRGVTDQMLRDIDRLLKLGRREVSYTIPS